MSQIRPIAQLGNAVLRKTALAITDFNDPWLAVLLADMHATMRSGNGVGIAAPQIAESWQVMIIASRPNSRYPHAPEMAPLEMINPYYEIIDATLQKDWEGCLSVPGIRAQVPRHRSILVDYQDAQGEPQQIALSDFPARVFQHEYDHLIGKVYLDRIESTEDIISESEFYKRITPEEQPA